LIVNWRHTKCGRANFSSFDTCAGFGANCLWITTEADRSVTTILLPVDY
jgi:hypothetical protein